MPPNRSQAQTQEQLPFLPCDDLRPGAEGLLAVMNADVQQLLMLSAPHFWDRLGHAADDSIVEMLDTFLRFRRRPYDELPQGSDVAAAAAQSEALQQLSCNVFRVLLRMTMPMERGAPPMRERSRLLYDAALLDLPKMMDIAVLYGHDNPQLVSQLVAQAFTMQARYREDLAAMVAVVAANLMEVLGACSDHISRARKDASSAHLPAVLDGLLYFQDVALTLSAFLRAYPPAAQQMLDGDASLLRALGDVYQQLLPPLSRLALAQADGSAAELRGKAAQMQLALLHLVHQLLDRGLLGDAAAAPSAAAGSSGGSSSSAGPASSNSRADPSAAGATLMEGLMCLSHPDTSDAFGLLPALARWYRLDTAVDAAMADGRLALDETQYQYLLAMLGVDTRAQPGRGPGTGSTAAGSQVDAVQLRSLISAVQDVLPELGDGFVAACLLQLGMDSETVLNRVLEDTLPPQLAALDRSAATNPLQAEACQGSGEAAAAGGADADQLPAGLGAMGVYARTRSAAEEWRAERDGRRAHFEPAASSSGRQLRSVPRSTARAFDLRRSDAKEAVKAHAIAMLWQDEYDDEFDDSMEDMVSAGTSSGLAVDDAVERHRSRIGRDPGREPTPDGAPGSSSSSAANGRAPAGGKAAQPVWVLDGKIYNYAKPGARQMASAVEAEATLQLEAQEIHGLGRGGNKAFFAAQHSAAAADPGPAEPAGRGRGGGGGRGRSGAPGRRGRGRGGGGGGAANHHRKDRALRKMAGPPE